MSDTTLKFTPTFTIQSLSMTALHGAEESSSRLVLLLLGERGSGKSSVGNAILGRLAFHKNTRRSSRKSASVSGIEVTVVDTPGWTSGSSTPGRVSRELCRGVKLCHPELPVLLLVLNTSCTFAQPQWDAMEVQLRLLHTPIWQRALVLFTNGDETRDQPVHEYIRQQGGTLQWLLERCGYRFQVMTNQPTASQVQVHDLFEKIHWMIEAKKHLGELQCSIHSQRRPDLSRTEEQRRQTRPDMLEGSPGYWMEMQTRRPGRPAGEQPALSLVLLGRRRSGKSSAGNTVLGRDHFQTNRKTTRCSAGQGWVSGRPVTVVDTPGWSRFGLARPQQVKEEMSRSPSLCPAGSRLAFLLAVPVDSFSEKDRGAVEAYLSVLGEEVWRSSVVLLTFGEELRGRTLERYVEGQGRSLQWLLDRCGRRMCVFDSNVDEQTQVRQLLEVVEQLVK